MTAGLLKGIYRINRQHIYDRISVQLHCLFSLQTTWCHLISLPIDTIISSMMATDLEVLSRWYISSTTDAMRTSYLCSSQQTRWGTCPLCRWAGRGSSGRRRAGWSGCGRLVERTGHRLNSRQSRTEPPPTPPRTETPTERQDSGGNCVNEHQYSILYNTHLEHKCLMFLFYRTHWARSKTNIILTDVCVYINIGYLSRFGSFRGCTWRSNQACGGEKKCWICYLKKMKCFAVKSGNKIFIIDIRWGSKNHFCGSCDLRGVCIQKLNT